jgi:hypothetical protein
MNRAIMFLSIACILNFTCASSVIAEEKPKKIYFCEGEGISKDNTLVKINFHISIDYENPVCIAATNLEGKVTSVITSYSYKGIIEGERINIPNPFSRGSKFTEEFIITRGGEGGNSLVGFYIEGFPGHSIPLTIRIEQWKENKPFIYCDAYWDMVYHGYCK